MSRPNATTQTWEIKGNSGEMIVFVNSLFTPSVGDNWEMQIPARTTLIQARSASLLQSSKDVRNHLKQSILLNVNREGGFLEVPVATKGNTTSSPCSSFENNTQVDKYWKFPIRQSADTVCLADLTVATNWLFWKRALWTSWVKSTELFYARELCLPDAGTVVALLRFLSLFFQSSVFPSLAALLAAPPVAAEPEAEEAVSLGWKANEAELMQ